MTTSENTKFKHFSDHGFPRQDALDLIGKKCYAIIEDKVLIGTCSEVLISYQKHITNDGQRLDVEKVYIRMRDRGNLPIGDKHELSNVAFSEDALADTLRKKWQ